MALAALAALAVIAALRYWRRRRARLATPLERARRALLVAEAHARAGRCRACVDVLADTLRAALAAHLGVEVLPGTTSELSELSRTRLRLAGDLDVPRIIALLETCDLARFARGRLAPDALLAITDVARELVRTLFAPQVLPKAAPPRAEVTTS